MTELLAPSDIPAIELPPANSAAYDAGSGLAAWIREVVWTAEQNSPRTRQREIGPSELGLACSRQIAYRIAGTVPTNVDVDPLAAIAGTAMHAWMAATFTRLNLPGRYLVEHPVQFRNIKGTLDLYDRRTRTVIDWKFPRKAKANRMRAEGPPRHYLWQGQTYAQGLIAEGETPEQVAVAYIPIDGKLADIYAFAYPVDEVIALQAVERLNAVAQQTTPMEHGILLDPRPGDVQAQPSRLCPWCPFHRPQWSGDLNLACPGQDAR